MAALILVGRWVDLYLMIVPPVTRGAAAFPWVEVPMMAAAAGVFGLAFFAWFARAPQVPLHDPRLQQSLSYHS
jgi:hypothetical protein